MMFWHYVFDHKGEIIAWLPLIITAGVKTLPIPGQPFRPYTWFYDWSHQFFNITNTRLTDKPIITPPEATKPNEPT